MVKKGKSFFFFFFNCSQDDGGNLGYQDKGGAERVGYLNLDS